MGNNKDKLLKFLKGLSDEEVVLINALSIKELKERGIVRSRNIVGDIGEFKAIQYYSNTPNEQNLQFAPEGTQNIDALSRKGERYSIKAITYPSKTTGVFYGLNSPDELKSGSVDKQSFEFVIIVILSEDFDVKEILELDWETFINNKRWHSRMQAWNLSLSKDFKTQCRRIFSVN